MRKFVVITTSVALICALFIGTPAAVYGSGANDIYVGSNANTTAASSCADPDRSTDSSNINTALDLALTDVNNDGDVVIICDGEYTYAADIPPHNGDIRHKVINIEAAAGAEVTLNGDENFQLLAFYNVTSVSVKGVNFLNGAVDGLAEPYGAAIRVYHGTLSVVDSTFSGNTAEWGGAIYSEPGHVTISGSHFTNNSATDSGGAVSVWHAADGEGVTVSNSTFTNNSVGEGAAISVDGIAASAIIAVSDSEFVNNDGKYAAITIDQGTVELNNVLMDGNNSTSGDGGAVWAEYGITAVGSDFINNSSDGDGGALYTRGGSDIRSSVFTNNSTGEGGEGGAIQLDGCSAEDTVSVSGSRFLRNSAGDSGGGAINFECEAGADVIVTQNRFTGNIARQYGGATDQENDDFEIRFVRNTFTGNQVSDSSGGSDGQGGAVWVYNASFSGNRFIRNRSSATGGAVYATDRQVARSAKRSSFSGNRAPRGADVYLSRNGE